MLTEWSQFCLVMKEHCNTYDTLLTHVRLQLGLGTKNPIINNEIMREGPQQKYCFFQQAGTKRALIYGAIICFKRPKAPFSI